jgi:hypothetical protein
MAVVSVQTLRLTLTLVGSRRRRNYTEAEGHVISIKVHMESLVQRCAYFQTMLSLNMLEQQTKRMR